MSVSSSHLTLILPPKSDEPGRSVVEEKDDCIVCLDEVAYPHVVHQGTMASKLCLNCLKTHVMINFGDRNLLTCPLCRRLFTNQEVTLILGEEKASEIFKKEFSEGRREFTLQEVMDLFGRLEGAIQWEKNMRLDIVADLEDELEQLPFGPEKDELSSQLAIRRNYLDVGLNEVFWEFLNHVGCIFLLGMILNEGNAKLEKGIHPFRDLDTVQRILGAVVLVLGFKAIINIHKPFNELFLRGGHFLNILSAYLQPPNNQ